MKLTIICGETSVTYEHEQEIAIGNQLGYDDGRSGTCRTNILIGSITTLCDKVVEMEIKRCEQT